MSTPCANCGGDIHFCKDCDFYKGEYIEKSVLDDIKAEIKDVAFDWQEIDGEHESFMVVDLNDVLQIIDEVARKNT